MQAVEQRTRNAPDLSEPDVVLMTQHNPVFTLGTGSTRDNLKFSPEDAPFEVVRTERGGEVTYHGPGQVREGLILSIWYNEKIGLAMGRNRECCVACTPHL